jgi:hypothetical protein
LIPPLEFGEMDLIYAGGGLEIGTISGASLG